MRAIVTGRRRRDRATRRRSTATLGILLAAVALTGCGPSASREALVAQVATDIEYGGKKTEAPAPAPVAEIVPVGNALAPGLPPFIQALPRQKPLPLPPLAPPVVACPSAGPLDSPELAATTDIAGLPAEASYQYRVTGTETTTDGLGKATSSEFPAETTRTVKNAQTQAVVTKPLTDPLSEPAGTVYTFDLVDEGESGTTTTSFEVSTSPANEVPAGRLAITRVVHEGEDETATFTPSPPVTVMPLPAAAGATWNSVSSDPAATGGPQQWVVEGLIGDVDDEGQYVVGSDRARVDACGALIEGWNVNLNIDITAPSVQLSYQANYVIATQYGGLPVQDHVVKTGNSGGTTIESSSTASISTVPQPAVVP